MWTAGLVKWKQYNHLVTIRGIPAPRMSGMAPFSGRMPFQALFSLASTHPTCLQKMFSTTAATGNPHRILPKVMRTMTALIADNTTVWCQLTTMTTSIASFTLSEPHALKANHCSNECIISHSSSTLHEIPTRILQNNLNNAAATHHADDDDCSPSHLSPSPLPIFDRQDTPYIGTPFAHDDAIDHQMHRDTHQFLQQNAAMLAVNQHNDAASSTPH